MVEHAKKYASALIGAVAALTVLAGCGRASRDPSADPPLSEPAAAQTEGVTELITELYEIETETDFFGEIQMRSIWEVMPDDTRLWAASFDAAQVEKVIYTTYMENEPDVYEMTDPATIQAVFEAIGQMEAAGAIAAPANPGDVFVFCMKDGEEQKFAFGLTSIVVGETAYETANTALLWELTGDLIFGEAVVETEY